MFTTTRVRHPSQVSEFHKPWVGSPKPCEGKVRYSSECLHPLVLKQEWSYVRFPKVEIAGNM